MDMSTPVVHLEPQAETPVDKVSLMDQIRKAKTKDEVEALLVKGTTFKYVSLDTARKWDRAAQVQLNSFNP